MAMTSCSHLSGTPWTRSINIDNEPARISSRSATSSAVLPQLASAQHRSSRLTRRQTMWRRRTSRLRCGPRLRKLTELRFDSLSKNEPSRRSTATSSHQTWSSSMLDGYGSGNDTQTSRSRWNPDFVLGASWASRRTSSRLVPLRQHVCPRGCWFPMLPGRNSALSRALTSQVPFSRASLLPRSRRPWSSLELTLLIEWWWSCPLWTSSDIWVNWAASLLAWTRWRQPSTASCVHEASLRPQRCTSCLATLSSSIHQSSMRHWIPPGWLHLSLEGEGLFFDRDGNNPCGRHRNDWKYILDWWHGWQHGQALQEGEPPETSFRPLWLPLWENPCRVQDPSTWLCDETETRCSSSAWWILHAHQGRDLYVSFHFGSPSMDHCNSTGRDRWRVGSPGPSDHCRSQGHQAGQLHPHQDPRLRRRRPSLPHHGEPQCASHVHSRCISSIKGQKLCTRRSDHRFGGGQVLRHQHAERGGVQGWLWRRHGGSTWWDTSCSHASGSKAKRISYSTSHAETLSMVGGMEASTLVMVRLAEFHHPKPQPSIKELIQVQEEGDPRLPIDFYGDCRDVFELTTGLRTLPQDKSQRLYILSLKECRLSGRMRLLTLVPTQCMTSDSLTKPMVHDSMLNLLTTGTVRFHNEPNHPVTSRTLPAVH